MSARARGATLASRTPCGVGPRRPTSATSSAWSAAAREHPDGGLAARGRGRDLGRDLGVEQARAVGDVAVVGGAHEHAGAQRGAAAARR